MKNSELNDFLLGLQSVKELKGFKFAVVVSKNIDVATSELKALQDAINPPEEISRYENTRIALCIKHAKKDEKGEPIVLNDKYVLEDKKAFEKQFEKLKKENQKILYTETARLKELELFLEEEANIELKMVSQDDVPDEISVEQVQAIKHMIQDY